MGTMIRIQNLTKQYGGGRGIKNLNMEVPEKCVFGYVGPNGAGKSTTIKILCGLVKPESGEAYIDGIPVLPKNHVQIKRTVGYLPDEFGVYDQMTVWEYLDFFGAAFKIPPKERRKQIQNVLELTAADHMKDYQVNSLSRGMHQKIGIAKTMLHDPKLLILDEPANGLDPHARIDMRNTSLRLKEIGKTVMLSSHILPELGSICDMVGIIERGQLLTQGTVKEISQKLTEQINLEIMVDSDIDEAARICRTFDQVKEVSFSGNEIRVEYLGKRQNLFELNKYLIDKGVRVMTLKESEVDLENVFLAVTGKDKKFDLSKLDAQPAGSGS